jgi:hypothetical protein
MQQNTSLFIGQHVNKPQSANQRLVFRKSEVNKQKLYIPLLHANCLLCDDIQFISIHFIFGMAYFLFRNKGEGVSIFLIVFCRFCFFLFYFPRCPRGHQVCRVGAKSKSNMSGNGHSLVQLWPSEMIVCLWWKKVWKRQFSRHKRCFSTYESLQMQNL